MDTSLVNFHHGGRIGDCLYAMYTVMRICEALQLKANIILSDYHRGGWSKEIAKSLEPLLLAQSYVEKVTWQSLPPEKRSPYAFPDYDEAFPENCFNLTRAEGDFNPELFEEWNHQSWPGNISIPKRYATHFSIPWDPNITWLTAEKIPENRAEVVFHLPKHRLTRSMSDYLYIIDALKVEGVSCKVIGNEQDKKLWQDHLRVECGSFLDVASNINFAECFVGCASSCYVVAEGLGVGRFVDFAPDCKKGIEASSMIQTDTTSWSPRQVIDAIVNGVTNV